MTAKSSVEKSWYWYVYVLGEEGFPFEIRLDYTPFFEDDNDRTLIVRKVEGILASRGYKKGFALRYRGEEKIPWFVVVAAKQAQDPSSVLAVTNVRPTVVTV